MKEVLFSYSGEYYYFYDLTTVTEYVTTALVSL